MKIKKADPIIAFCLLLISFSPGWAQLSSGRYSSGLHIAFDSTQQIITGYFEKYSGYDETLKRPRFSCIFYIHGIMKEPFIPIKTYFPFEQNADTIVGYIKIVNENLFEMKLDEEHGGCGNISHFSDEPIIFNLEKKTNALRVSYSLVPEINIYSDFTSNKKWLVSIKSNQLFYIEEKQNGWCRIIVDGTQAIRGWVSSKDLFGF